MVMANTISTDKWNWLSASITIAVAMISASAAISVYISRKKSKDLVERITELENALKVSQDKCAAERQGRTRAQQAVRKALTNDTSNKSNLISYPMAPIAVVQSCFATRYGTPRQPLLVPLARACLVFNTSLVPLAALEGLAEYSHCWIIYVFHLNTDLEKLWKHPSRSKFKAKVRVPKLKGGRMGVFATRSPHRPCPIGLTVAKVEAVQGNMVLLSGVDLVDGTPVLDIKPYLPYCDSIQGAAVPEWVTTDGSLGVASVKFSDEFSSTLASCWHTAEEKSLYASPDEFQTLVKQILSWDIRSLSQRIQPHNIMLQGDNKLEDGRVANSAVDVDGDVSSLGSLQGPFPSTPVIYHLMLEELDVAYRIDDEGNVVVGKVVLFPNCKNRSQYPCSNAMWRNVVS